MEIFPQRPEKTVFPHFMHTFHLAVGLIHLLDDPWVDGVVVHQGTPFPHNLWTVPLHLFWCAVYGVFCVVICGIKTEALCFLAITLQIPCCRTHATVTVDHFHRSLIVDGTAGRSAGIFSLHPPQLAPEYKTISPLIVPHSELGTWTMPWLSHPGISLGFPSGWAPGVAIWQVVPSVGMPIQCKRR